MGGLWEKDADPWLEGPLFLAWSGAALTIHQARSPFVCHLLLAAITKTACFEETSSKTLEIFCPVLQHTWEMATHLLFEH